VHTGLVCGRYAASRDSAVLIEEFQVDRAPEKELPADYNVAPSKDVYIVADRPRQDVPELAERNGERAARELAVARWGLVPHWAKDVKIGSRMINARLETVAEKPAYRQAFKKRRCLLPADGYYEWYRPSESGPQASKARKPAKQPYYIHPADNSVLAMAGLYELWRDPTTDPQDPKGWLRTTTIITTRASDELGRIHDRMPVCVQPEFWSDWLDPELHDQTALFAVLTPAAPEWLKAEPVSREVNSVRNNGPDLILPLPAS
jgi:putative SOS response-associated peptidase YedK